MKKLKRVLPIVLSMAIALGGVACNNTDTDPDTNGGETTAPGGEVDPGGDDEKESILYYTPFIGDFGLGDMGHRASLAAAEKYDLDFKMVEYGVDSSVAVNSFLDALETQHYDYVVASSWYITDVTLANAEKYSDTDFILFDTGPDVDMSAHDNLYGITFGQNEGGFLVAAYSALMSETNTIGAAIRSDNPILNDFGTGWLAGYKYMVAEHGMDDLNGIYSYIGEDSVQNTYETVRVLFDSGADYIWSVAGTNNLGAAQAAEENGGVDAGYNVIGVDYDQWEYFSSFENAEETAVGYNNIVTSMLKNIEASVALVFESLMGESDEIQPGNSFYGVGNGGTGLVRNERYHQVTPDEVDAVITDLEEKIKSGEIDVPSFFDFETYEAFAEYRDNPAADFVP